MVILHYCLRRRADLSLDAFSAYWHGPHAQLVTRLAPAIGVIRYVQHHALARGSPRNAGHAWSKGAI